MTKTTNLKVSNGAEILVPLNKLKKSPKNVRKVPHGQAEIEALAASIAANGLLQNLVVEPEQVGGKPTGCYLVTRAELRNFKAASLYPSDSSATGELKTDADLARLRKAQRQFPSCADAGFRNGYEVGLFSRFGADKMLGDLKLALTAAQLPVPAALGSAPAQPMDKAARQAISSLKAKYGLSGDAVFDRMFYETMLKTLER